MTIKRLAQSLIDKNDTSSPPLQVVTHSSYILIKGRKRQARANLNQQTKIKNHRKHIVTVIFLLLNTCAKAENSYKRFWCERRDLNPHARRRQILNLVRLPFRHSRKRFAEINRVQRVCDYCILRIHHPSIFGVIEPFNLRAYLPHLLFISHSNKKHLFYFSII